MELAALETNPFPLTVLFKRMARSQLDSGSGKGQSTNRKRDVFWLWPGLLWRGNVRQIWPSLVYIPTFVFSLLPPIDYNASGLDGRQGSAGKRPERRSRGQDRSGVSFPAPRLVCVIPFLIHPLLVTDFWRSGNGYPIKTHGLGTRVSGWPAWSEPQVKTQSKRDRPRSGSSRAHTDRPANTT